MKVKVKVKVEEKGSVGVRIYQLRVYRVRACVCVCREDVSVGKMSDQAHQRRSWFIRARNGALRIGGSIRGFVVEIVCLCRSHEVRHLSNLRFCFEAWRVKSYLT